jgi:hypothetical protein
MYTKHLEEKIDDRLLATHIADNPEFTVACATGDAAKIMSIVETEMMENDLFTKGSKKLQSDIRRMLQGKSKVPSYIGNNVLMFVWNSRMSGIGFAVAN